MEEILEQMEEQESSNQHYIDAINNLKSNSVSKDAYNKLVEENKNLLQSLVNGSQVSADEAPVEEKDLMQLRRELFKPEKELSDIEYVEKALELRARVLEETGEDCFVAKAHGYTPGYDAFQSAEKTAAVFQECLDEANGSNERFISALQTRIKGY